MTMKKTSQRALALVEKAPLLWINLTLVALLCAGLAKPLASDWLTQRSAASRGQVVSASGFFDFSSFMNSLTGLIQSFAQGLDTFIEAPVSAYEKGSAAQKEQVQAGVNAQAAEQAQEAGAGAIDLVAADSPEACTIKRETMETVDAAHETSLLARAKTQYSARRSMYSPSSLGASKELLNASFDDYCSPESFARGNCKNGVSPKNMPDADINAASIMGTSDGMSNKMSQDEIDAADKYVSWVTDPVPYENPPLALSKTPAGQRLSVEMRRRAAISSAAQFSLNRIIASRTEKR
jgi:hypothetical protein